MKRLINIFLAVCVLATSVALFPASAAEKTTNEIYFDAKQWGGNFKTVYCHIWEIGGDSFWGWQAKVEACTKKSGTIWAYDLSKLNNSTYLTGGLKPGVDYCVIFSADTGAQTYDMTFSTECIGDKAYMSGSMTENTVDSEKHAYTAYWTDNADKYGPHFAITSIGNIVGDFLGKNEKPYEVIGSWIAIYYDYSAIPDRVGTLISAMKAMNYYDVDRIKSYIINNFEDNDPRIYEYLDKAKALCKTPQKVTAKSFTKTLGAKAFNLNAKAKTKLSYKSSDKSVAVVSKSGKVTLKGVGVAKIKIKAAETNKYLSASKTITIKVNFPEIKSLSVVQKSAGKVYVTHSKVKGVSGFNLKLSSDGVYREKNVKGGGAFSLSGLSKGKWTLKIRAYGKSGGVKIYSDWKSVKFTVR